MLGCRSALAAKDRIGYLPEERGVYRKMKVGAFLIYMAQLKGLTAEGAASRVPRLLQDIGLPGVDGKRCEDLVCSQDLQGRPPDARQGAEYGDADAMG